MIDRLAHAELDKREIKRENKRGNTNTSFSNLRGCNIRGDSASTFVHVNAGECIRSKFISTGARAREGAIGVGAELRAAVCSQGTLVIVHTCLANFGVPARTKTRVTANSVGAGLRAVAVVDCTLVNV
jgi:hypothetical protein